MQKLTTDLGYLDVVSFPRPRHTAEEMGNAKVNITVRVLGLILHLRHTNAQT